MWIVINHSMVVIVRVRLRTRKIRPMRTTTCANLIQRHVYPIHRLSIYWSWQPLEPLALLLWRLDQALLQKHFWLPVVSVQDA